NTPGPAGTQIAKGKPIDARVKVSVRPYCNVAQPAVVGKVPVARTLFSRTGERYDQMVTALPPPGHEAIRKAAGAAAIAAAPASIGFKETRLWPKCRPHVVAHPLGR